VTSGIGAERSASSDGAGPVVVGSAARDVAAADPRGWRLGGAVTYAGLALARLGLEPRILMGADPEAAAAEELELLRRAGADLSLVPLARGPVFDNRQVGGLREQHCLGPGDPLPVAALPAAWRGAGDWLLVPVAGELETPGRTCRRLGPRRGRLAGAPARHAARRPAARRPPGASPLLGRADLVVVSRLDFDPETRIADLGAFLRRGATLVVTDGEAGGEVWRVEGVQARPATRYEAIAASELVDGTGAGDTFLAGLVAARMGHPLAFVGPRGADGPPGADLRLAAAIGSLTVEGLGVRGVPSLPAIEERLRAWLRPG
jgi:sugar/nucleoside kinase (ribokinase family)